MQRLVRRSFWSGCVLLAAAAMLVIAPARGEQFIAEPAFAPGSAPPSLAAWRIDPAVGGSFKVEEAAGAPSTVILTGERIVAADGQQDHAGRLIRTSRTPVVPGRSYTLRVEACGEGKLKLGAVEFADKYSPMRVGLPVQSTELTPDWKTLTFTFTPSDATMYASPFFEAQGWLGHAAIRNPSFEDTVTPGAISIKAVSFVFAAGQPVTVQIAADHSPVKLLVYGPAGVPPGPGGPFGGSDAWIDHFQFAQSATVQPGAPSAALSLSVPKESREGFYRIVAVDPVTGQKAEAQFSIYPQATADELHALAAKINLPEGSRLIFLGDSLTDFYRGRNYVDLVARAIASKHGDKVTVRNAGIGGNNIDQIEKRLDRDVIAHKPTHVFIFEGANDSKRNYNPETGLRDQWAYPIEAYEPSYKRVIETIKAAGAQVIIMTMAPGDQTILEPFRQRAKTFKRSINFFCLPEDTAKAVALQKKLAAEYKLPVIDTHAHLQALLDRSDKAQYLHVDDGVHISEHGNREVGLMVLRYLAGAGQ